MKIVRGSAIGKLVIGLVVIALLTGCAYNAVFGIAFAVVDAREWAGAVLNIAMENHTQQATDYYFLQKEYADTKEADIPKWAQQELARYETELNSENTNFRFAVYQGEEQIFGNYAGENVIATSYDWEERFVGTDLDRQRLQAMENNWAYDYENNVALQGVGGTVYPVLAEHKLPEKYAYYDVYGNYYDARGNVIAYNGKYYDEQGNFIHKVEKEADSYTAIVVDGTTYYPIDPDEGYPEEFVYRNDYGKIFDRELNFIMYEADYGTNIVPKPTPTPQIPEVQTQLVVTPTPKPVGSPAPAEKPQLVELKELTSEEREAIRAACYEEYAIRGYVLEDMPVSDGYAALYGKVMEYAATEGNYLKNAAILGIGGLVLLAVLLVLAGKCGEDGTYEASGLGRLPWDVWLVLICCMAVCVGGIVFVAMEVTMEALYYNGLEVNLEFFDLAIYGCTVAAAMCLALLVGVLHSAAARVKVRGWLRNCLCWKLCVWAWRICAKCCKWLWKCCKRVAGAIKLTFTSIPLVWKAAVILGAVSAADFIFYCINASYGEGAGIALLWHIVRFLLLMIICLVFKRVQDGARIIADGDLTHRISVDGDLLGIFRSHAEHLNRIGEGLSRSVDSQLRAERMKTELITNVSHDLKTPLTSIISYVGLLKQEGLTGTAGEYVEVLDRQAARLKKLTEDLVEASKASSGALQVTVERVCMGELAEQALAEYTERLAQQHLTVVYAPPSVPVEVWGDGKYVWRILDNLLSNVCKYAMPDTRVYLEVCRVGDRGVLRVKNISRECLNITAEELMERFVRGDASRNTEGSGLGLSIARSLAELMGGELVLVVDGDLFKAEIHLPLAK